MRTRTMCDECTCVLLYPNVRLASIQFLPKLFSVYQKVFAVRMNNCNMKTIPTIVTCLSYKKRNQCLLKLRYNISVEYEHVHI